MDPWDIESRLTDAHLGVYENRLSVFIDMLRNLPLRGAGTPAMELAHSRMYGRLQEAERSGRPNVKDLTNLLRVFTVYMEDPPYPPTDLIGMEERDNILHSLLTPGLQDVDEVAVIGFREMVRDFVDSSNGHENGHRAAEVNRPVSQVDQLRETAHLRQRLSPHQDRSSGPSGPSSDGNRGGSMGPSSLFLPSSLDSMFDEMNPFGGNRHFNHGNLFSQRTPSQETASVRQLPPPGRGSAPARLSAPVRQPHRVDQHPLGQYPPPLNQTGPRRQAPPATLPARPAAGPPMSRQERIQKLFMPMPEGDCLFCCEKYDAGHPAVILPCGHAAGKLCLERWFMDNSTCPVCRHKYHDKLGLPDPSDDSDDDDFENVPGYLSSEGVRQLLGMTRQQR